MSNILDKMDDIADNLRTIYEFFADTCIKLVTSIIAVFITEGWFASAYKGSSAGAVIIFLFRITYSVTIVLSAAALVSFLLASSGALKFISQSAFDRSRSFSEFISKIYDSVSPGARRGVVVSAVLLAYAASGHRSGAGSVPAHLFTDCDLDP
jgi:hypothetical protein